MSYHVGQEVQVLFDFTNAAGAYVDPTVVTLELKTPDGTKTPYVYPTAPEITKTSTGRYVFKKVVTASGMYYYRPTGTGALIAADEGAFFVVESQFA